MGLKKYLSAKNIAALAASPFTAGASLALLDNGDGSSIIGEFTGENSAKRAQQTQFTNQMALQKDAQNFAKWQMTNAHQAEMQDLEKAGINRVLTAGGSGASAGVTEGSASMANTSPSNNIEAILNTAKMISDIKKQDAETGNIKQDTKNKAQTFELTPGLTKSVIDLNNATSTKNHAEAKKTLEEEININLKNHAQEILNRMQDMDYEKRKAAYNTEMLTYITQMSTELKRAGLNNNQIKIAIDEAFSSVGKIFRSVSVNNNGGSTYNVTKTYNTNSPTVNY